MEIEKMDGKEIRPMGDKLLVERIPVKGVTDGGLLLPEISQRSVGMASEGTGFCVGVVLALGQGRKTRESGKVVPFQCGVGDRVYFNRFGGHELDVRGKDYLLISETEILAREDA
jgi:chaperonin GroES